MIKLRKRNTEADLKKDVVNEKACDCPGWLAKLTRWLNSDRYNFSLSIVHNVCHSSITSGVI